MSACLLLADKRLAFHRNDTKTVALIGLLVVALDLLPIDWQVRNQHVAVRVLLIALLVLRCERLDASLLRAAAVVVAVRDLRCAAPLDSRLVPSRVFLLVSLVEVLLVAVPAVGLVLRGLDFPVPFVLAPHAAVLLRLEFLVLAVPA